MSELDRACALLADLLGNGPRHASEILAAAEGANVSKRTMQRAANILCVVKSRPSFRGGWIWCLPGEEAEAESTKSPSPATESASGSGPKMGGESVRNRKVSQHFAERAEVIAARLRKLEAARGKTAPIYAMDRRLVGWVQSGITDPDLREAYELAVFALVKSRSQAPVTVGFLCDFVEKVIAEGATA